ncbi:YjbH domain-containing protein [bacterium]|nr:YjbH domain-containing protein [bacterium]
MLNSKMLALIAIAAMAMMSLASGLAAAPAYPGYTGLIFTPTADTLNMGGVNFGASYLSSDDIDTSYFSANIGIINGFEVGAALLDPDEGDNDTILNAKYSVLKETFATPGIAFGVSDLTDEIDVTPYVVVTKTLDIPKLTLHQIKGSIGFGDGTLDGVFAGLSAVISDNLTLMTEYDTDNLNIGLQFAAAGGFRAHVDLIDGDDIGFGLNFNKGF